MALVDLTQTTTFKVWAGSTIFRGVDLSGILEQGTTISLATFEADAALPVSGVSVSGKKAWASFDCTTAGTYRVKATLTCSDTQVIVIVFYIQVAAVPA